MEQTGLFRQRKHIVPSDIAIGITGAGCARHTRVIASSHEEAYAVWRTNRYGFKDNTVGRTRSQLVACGAGPIRGGDEIVEAALRNRRNGTTWDCGTPGGSSRSHRTGVRGRI